MMCEHNVSGYDFVRAMLLDGYQLLGTTMGHALLERRDSELLVPQHGALAETTLVSLLRRAKISRSHLTELLTRLHGSEMWFAQREIPAVIGHALRRL